MRSFGKMDFSPVRGVGGFFENRHVPSSCGVLDNGLGHEACEPEPLASVLSSVIMVPLNVLVYTDRTKTRCRFNAVWTLSGGCWCISLADLSS